MTSLILIDGPPGVGKTTVGNALAEALPAYRFLHEMDKSHPLHPVPVGNLGADFTAMNQVSVADAAGIMLQKWVRFLATFGEEEGYVFESYPYQSHLRVLWQLNASEADIQQWQSELFELLGPYEPLLVSIHFRDNWEQMKKVYEARGSDWMKFLTGFIMKTPKGISLGLDGEDVALPFLRMYHENLQSWIARWPFQLVELEAWAQAPREQALSIIS